MFSRALAAPWFSPATLILFLALSALFTCLGELLLWRLRVAPIGIDDANIFFGYAQNLADGFGLVYNPGGERVEGYSSTLWLLLITPLFKLFEAPEFSMLVLSATCMGLGFTAFTKSLYRFLDTHFAQQTPLLSARAITWFSFLPLIWVIAMPYYIYWTVISLMETGLWAALFIMVVSCFLAFSQSIYKLRIAILFTVLNSLLIITRPESLAWVPIFAVSYICVCLIRFRTEFSITRNAILPIAVPAAVLYGFTSWRISYFGFPLANTYYAKATDDFGYKIISGLHYNLKFFFSNPLIILSVFALGYMIWRIAKNFREAIQGDENAQYTTATLFICILVFALLVPFLVGGDHFGGYRFMLHVWPLFLVVLIFIIIECLITLNVNTSWLSKTSSTLLISFMVVVFFCLSNEKNWYNVYNQYTRVDFQLAEKDRALGQSLNRLFSNEKPTLGVIAAGGIRVGYDGFIYDMVGLNNVAMGHSDSGDRTGFPGHIAFYDKIFYEQMPNLLLAEKCESAPEYNYHVRDDSFYNFVLKKLLHQEEFQSKYQYYFVENGNDAICTYISNQYLVKLKTQQPDLLIERIPG